MGVSSIWQETPLLLGTGSAGSSSSSSSNFCGLTDELSNLLKSTPGPGGLRSTAHGRGMRSSFDGILQASPNVTQMPPGEAPAQNASKPAASEELPGTEAGDEAAREEHDTAEQEEVDDRDDLPMHEGRGIVDNVDSAGFRPHKEYDIFVDTGLMGRSSTNGNIYIQLFGSGGRTGLIHLKRGFQAASRNEFSLFAYDVGPVEKIRLMADTDKKWFCDRVWLKQPEGMLEFPVARWIGWPENPEVTVIPALASMGPLGAALAALITTVVPSLATPTPTPTPSPTARLEGGDQTPRPNGLSIGAGKPASSQDFL